MRAPDLSFVDARSILMDLHMPVMDGLEATRRIRELETGVLRGRRRPIIALTANVSDEAHRSAIEAGMDAFLHKVRSSVLGELTDSLSRSKSWALLSKSGSAPPQRCKNGS